VGIFKMKIDTEIRHVTKRGENLFLQLGFTPAEARRLKDLALTAADLAIGNQLEAVRPVAEPTKNAHR
jgi:hypothetical protein